MSSDTPSSCRVLVLSLPEAPPELTPVLSEHLGLNKIDARIFLHNLPGLLKPTLERSSAEALSTAIHEAGGYAVVVDNESIPDLAHPTLLHHMRCVDAGLEIVGLDGEPEQTLAWSELSLLNIGVLPLEQSHHENTSMAAVHTPHLRDLHADIESMRGPEAWLIADNPLRCWVIKQTEMNYEYLGDRKQTSASLNFRLMIDDLIAHAKQIYLAPAARAFTGHGLFRHYAFDSEDELEQNTLFHLLICRRMHLEQDN